MFLRNKKADMVTPDRALPGRADEMPVANRHTVLGTPLRGPWPEGLEIAYFGMGCFWGAERLFWRVPGVYSTAVGYQGGFTPNPTYEETCTGLTGHTEAVQVVYDPAKVSYEDLLKVFWENHDPTQGMRQGNDVGIPVPVGDLRHDRRSTRAGRRVTRRVRPRGPRVGSPRYHDRDHDGGAVLLRRGLPPAVPVRCQEPERVLQPRPQRPDLPRRRRPTRGAH